MKKEADSINKRRKTRRIGVEIILYYIQNKQSLTDRTTDDNKVEIVHTLWSSKEVEILEYLK